jgi:hypothetical protein
LAVDGDASKGCREHRSNPLRLGDEIQPTPALVWPGRALKGCLAFLATLTFGAVVTVVIIRAIPPEVPQPKGDFDGLGDYLRTLMILCVGATLSFTVSVAVGVVVAFWGPSE